MREEQLIKSGCVSFFTLAGGLLGAWIGAASPEKRIWFSDHWWLVAGFLVFTATLMSVSKFTPLTFFLLAQGKHRLGFIPHWLSAIVLLISVDWLTEQIGLILAAIVWAVLGGLLGIFAYTFLLYEEID